MKTLSITVTRDTVYEEVSKTTSFDGAKKDAEDGTYERVMTTEDDRQMLARYFDEAAQAAEAALSDLPTDDTTDGEQWGVTLRLPDAFNDKAAQSINADMFSYFCESILGKWYATTLYDVSERHTLLSAGFLQDALRKIWFRAAPSR